MINGASKFVLLLPLLMCGIQASVPAAKDSYSRFGVGNVVLLQTMSTHKAKSIAISQRIASMLGLVEARAVLPSPSVEFLFQPDMVKLQVRPDIPPAVPGFVVDLKINSISIIPDLQKDEMIISSKIRMPRLHSENIKWVCFMEVKQRAGAKLDFVGALGAAAEYNLSDPEERYYYVRRYIKRLFEDYRTGLSSIENIENELEELKFDRMLRRLTMTRLEDLWAEALKYNKKYCQGSVRLKWILYLSIGKSACISPIKIFSPIDIGKITLIIVEDKSASDMIDLLRESEIIASLKSKQKRALTRSIRRKNYMDSPDLALATIDLLRDVYSLEWIRSDIIALIVLSSAKKGYWKETAAVQEFLSVMTEDYQGYLSRTWLKTFLQTIKLFNIHQKFEEWQGCGLFGIYLWILYNRVPQFFMNVEWTTFKDQRKNQVSPFSDLKDAVLELTPLVPCLKLKNIANWSRPHSKDIPSIIQSTISQFYSIDSPFVAKEAFKYMMLAVDYWLKVTGFCDAIVLLNQEPATPPTEVGQVAKVLGKEIMRAFQHLARLQKTFVIDPSLVLRFLFKLKLSRATLVLIWSKTLPLPQDDAFIVDSANNDLYGTAYVVWASRLVEPSILARTLSSGCQAMLSGGQSSEALIGVINSAGEELNDPCGDGETQKEVVWHLPDIMSSGSLGIESSIALIRSYLLFKFSVPFGVTRSNITLVALDRIQPFEYAQFMNFWLDRHCALKCQSSKKPTCKPKYKIVIDGVDIR